MLYLDKTKNEIIPELTGYESLADFKSKLDRTGQLSARQTELDSLTNSDVRGISEAEYQEILDSRALSAKRESVKTEINAYLIEQLELGVEFQGAEFQAREEDLIRMNNALTKISLGGVWGGYWRDRNNQWQPITETQLGVLALTAGTYWENCFRISRVLIDGLPSKSLAQLDSYSVAIEWNAVSV